MNSKFFSHYLTGKGEMDLPEATIYNTGTTEWMAFESWPPSNTENRQLYFHSDSRLSFEKPARNEGYDEYISDPKKPVPYHLWIFITVMKTIFRRPPTRCSTILNFHHTLM